MIQDAHKQSIEPQGTITPIETKKLFYKKMWFIIPVSAIGLLLITWLLMSIVKPTGHFITSSTSAENTFYEMLEAASQKTKVHFLYEARQEAKNNSKATYIRSLAEFDAKNKEYSTVFIDDSLYFRAARCVTGKEYRFTSKMPKTVAEAETVINSNWSKEDRDPIGICDYFRVRQYGSITDGVLPVAISEAQAKGMIQGLQQRKSVTYKDEGDTTYNGVKAHKISFELSQQQSDKTNSNASTFFFAFRDGPSSEIGANFDDLDNVKQHFENKFYQASPIPELKGYYLIDKQTKLPLYSETITMGAGVNRTILSSIYSFPDTLSMNENTPLPQINKP